MFTGNQSHLNSDNSSIIWGFAVLLALAMMPKGQNTPFIGLSAALYYRELCSLQHLDLQHCFTLESTLFFLPSNF